MTADNSFALRLLGKLAGEEPRQNIFVSPASVALALGMALAGAEGATRDELAALLGLGEAPLDRLRALGQDLDGIGGGGAKLSSANALWASQRVPPRPEYVARCRELFGAHVAALDFRDPRSVAAINAWVSDHTAGKIPSLLGGLDPLTLLVLTNAIHFKGTWRHQFDPARTRPATFHGRDGAREVQLMRLSGDELRYAETGEYQAVSLPYGAEGGTLAMDVVLPRAGVALGRVIGGLDAVGWRALSKALRPRKGTLELPRFRAEYSGDLSDALGRLGVRRAFTPGQAEFGAMSAGEPSISAVVHKAVLEVNEEGAEAAAATAVVMVLSAMLPGAEPFHMRVDRPFLLAIRDAASGLILFLGAIVEPNQ